MKNNLGVCHGGKQRLGPRSAAGRRIARGQDTVEFALIFPLLFLVLMVIFDLGRLTYYSSALRNAAREGARYGSVFYDDDLGIEAAARQLAVGLPADEVVVEASVDEDAETINVSVQYSMTLVTPLIGRFFSNENVIPMSSQATMHIEYLGP